MGGTELGREQTHGQGHTQGPGPGANPGLCLLPTQGALGVEGPQPSSPSPCCPQTQYGGGEGAEKGLLPTKGAEAPD